MSPSTHFALPAGTRLESYEIVSVLGVGGFGITYKGFDHQLRCDVAIKEYLPSGLAVRAADGVTVVASAEAERATYAAGLRRFLDEGRVLARFKERAIVHVNRFLEQHGTAYLIMDYEEGESLAERLKRVRTLTEAEALGIVVPLLAGLSVVHARDFLHRDIKPGNIFLRRDGSPVLLDFGSAREVLSEHTQALTGMVTPGYAPFEQYQVGRKQGPWTDLYAIGATLYHCLTGKAPVGAPDRVAAIQEGARDPMPSAVEAGRGRWRGELLALIDWMLAPLAKERPQTVDEVLARLRALGPAAPARATEVVRTEVVADVPTRPSTRAEVETFETFRRRAEGGEVEAQYRLGVLYASGFGTDRDGQQALAWLHRAAEQNHVAAQLRLGLMLARGAGVTPDAAQALAWLRKAAEQDDAAAQFNLGLMHAHGIGVTRDRAQAQQWYRKAAAHGHPGAQANLRVIERIHGRSWWRG
jgi:hypothetical protein